MRQAGHPSSLPGLQFGGSLHLLLRYRTPPLPMPLAQLRRPYRVRPGGLYTDKIVATSKTATAAPAWITGDGLLSLRTSASDKVVSVAMPAR